MTDARTPDDPRPGEGATPPTPPRTQEAGVGQPGEPTTSSTPSLHKGDAGQSTPTGYGAPQYGAPEPPAWQASGAGSYPPPGTSGPDHPPAGTASPGPGGPGGPAGPPAPSDPAGGYGGAPAAYGGYGGPPAGYAAPPAGFAAPPADYGTPPADYAPGTYAAPPAGYGAPGSPTPPKKKRTGLIIGLVAGGLVVVVALAVGLFLILAGGSGDKPQATVQAYLQALADGNAADALAQGEKPSDTTFVTDAALKTQRDIAKITDISVSSGYTGSSTASVSATYKFGDRQASERFSLTKIGGKWKLDAVTYPVDVSSLDDVPGLTVLGIEVGDKSEVNVFPGPLTWGSTNAYISVKDSDPNDYSLSPGDYGSFYSSLETGLTDKGEQAVADAVTTYLSGCAASKDLEPANCPQSEYDFDAVDGSATWTPPADLSSLKYQTGSPVTDVYVSGDLTWSVTYTSNDGLGTVKQVTVDDVDGSLYGTVDLTQDPPVYSE